MFRRRIRQSQRQGDRKPLFLDRGMEGLTRCFCCEMQGCRSGAGNGAPSHTSMRFNQDLFNQRQLRHIATVCKSFPFHTLCMTLSDATYDVDRLALMGIGNGGLSNSTRWGVWRLKTPNDVACRFQLPLCCGRALGRTSCAR